MVGSAAVAHCAHSALISRVRGMALRSGGVHNSRRSTTREDRMICTPHMIGWERIDMCTVVPYEYMSVGGVLNGLIYLILSSPTCVDAVWRALRPFKEGEKLGSGAARVSLAQRVSLD